MCCRRQYSASFFSRRGLVWATNQGNSDTARRFQEKLPAVNPKLLLVVTHFGGARLLTSRLRFSLRPRRGRLARITAGRDKLLAPPKWQMTSSPCSFVRRRADQAFSTTACPPYPRRRRNGHEWTRIFLQTILWDQRPRNLPECFLYHKHRMGR